MTRELARRHRAALAALAALALGYGAAACRGGSAKTKRSGGAAPVEVVAGPQLPDAGRGLGPNTVEAEPNDGDEVATPLALGGTARGKIEPETDVDYYRVDVDAPGALELVLGGIEGVDLVLELVDPTGAVIARSDRGGARVKDGVPNAGVSSGRYMIVVRQAPAKKKPRPRGRGRQPPEPEAPGPAPVYELTAQLVPIAKGHEHEPDDDRGTANDLIVADSALGFVGWSGDVDMWKLSLEASSPKNALDVQLAAVEGVALELEIIDAIGRPLLARKAPRGQPIVVRAVWPRLAQGAPPFLYLNVRGDRSNPETTYTLTATERVIAPDEEVEPNDAPDRAMELPPDRTVIHAVWTVGDVDCFAIAPAGVARNIDVTIDTPGELDLAVELLADGVPIASANAGKKGVAEKLGAAVPAGARPVVRVRNADAGATTEARYDVTVHESDVTGDNAP